MMIRYWWNSNEKIVPFHSYSQCIHERYALGGQQWYQGRASVIGGQTESIGALDGSLVYVSLVVVVVQISCMGLKFQETSVMRSKK